MTGQQVLPRLVGLSLMEAEHGPRGQEFHGVAGVHPGDGLEKIHESSVVTDDRREELRPAAGLDDQPQRLLVGAKPLRQEGKFLLGPRPPLRHLQLLFRLGDQRPVPLAIHNEFADGHQIVTLPGRFSDAEAPEELRPSFGMLELTGTPRTAEQDRRVVLDRDAPAVALVDRRHVVHAAVRPQRARNIGRLLGNGDLRTRRARCLRGGRRGVGRALGGLYHREYAHGNHLSQLQNR